MTRSPSKSRLPAASSDTGIVSANESLIRRAIDEIWNRGDLDAADELFAADFVDHLGLISDLVRGPESVKVTAALYRLAFPDLRVTVDDVSNDTHTIVVRWSATSGGAGPPYGLDGQSHHHVLTGMTWSRVAQGMIIESWTHWDRLGALRKLGPLADE